VKTILSQGYKLSDADPCVFIKEEKDRSISIIAIFVDDCLIIGKKEFVNHIKKMLSNHFKMQDLGPIESIIGFKIERNENETTISQEKYIDNILRKFNMTECKQIDTPMLPVSNKPPKDKNKKEDFLDSPPKDFQDISLYQQAIGNLIYLANGSRPDICYAVNSLARKMQQPSVTDWEATKRVIRYLKGTKNSKIVYSVDPKPLIGYTDASYADDKETRKSTGGYLFTLNGGAISWRSKKQSIVACSSTEAEYIALSDATKEAKWLNKLQEDLKVEKKPTIIYEDNQSTIMLAENSIHNERSKHIDTRYHYIREQIEEGYIRVVYIATEYQPADSMTKALARIKHRAHSARMGLIF
jgi:hypothetical protein